MPEIPRGQQTGLREINRGNGRAEVFRKSEHYVFDTKVRAFWRGVTKTGRKRLAFPPECL
jgi:hypothetical protein